MVPSHAMRLVPCTGCRRHADALERACPFCGARLEAAAAPPRRRVGNLTRAAIFYFGASVASVGCGGPDEEPVVQPYGAPPDPPPEDRIAQPYGAPPEPEDDPLAEEPPSDQEQEADEAVPPEDDPPRMAPAYGGPPPREP